MNAASTLSRCVMGLAALAALTPEQLRADLRPIDIQHSRLTVFVDKAGLFSAFADDHMISAPISSGTISDSPPWSINIVVSAVDLTVLDPGLDPTKRAEVRTRMLGPDVLDTTRFPSITFESTLIDSTRQDRWNVSGRLTIRGITRRITFSVVRANDRYRGEARIRQRDFGIEPIRIAGGTVRVKDELRIEFEVAALETSQR